MTDEENRVEQRIQMAYVRVSRLDYKGIAIEWARQCAERREVPFVDALETAAYILERGELLPLIEERRQPA